MGGLYTNRTTSQSDFATVVYRAQLLGFNAVRLPFRFASCAAQTWLSDTAEMFMYFTEHGRQSRIINADTYARKDV